MFFPLLAGTSCSETYCGWNVLPETSRASQPSSDCDRQGAKSGRLTGRKQTLSVSRNQDRGPGLCTVPLSTHAALDLKKFRKAKAVCWSLPLPLAFFKLNVLGGRKDEVSLSCVHTRESPRTAMGGNTDRTSCKAGGGWEGVWRKDHPLSRILDASPGMYRGGVRDLCLLCGLGPRRRRQTAPGRWWLP